MKIMDRRKLMGLVLLLALSFFSSRGDAEDAILDTPYLQKEKEWTSWDFYAYDYKNAEPVFKPEELYDYVKILEPWWIWGKIDGDVRKYPEETGYFRKAVDIPGRVLYAKARITSEKDYRIFVNEKLVKEEPKAADRDFWMSPQQRVTEVDLVGFLKEGKNVICIQADAEASGFRGIYFRGEVVYETPEYVVRLGIPSDETWSFSRKREEDWTEVGFDDSRWDKTQVLWNHLYYMVHPFDNYFIKPDGFEPSKELFWGSNHYLPEKISRRKKEVSSVFKELKKEDIIKVKVAIFSEEGFPAPGAPSGFTPSYIKAVLEEAGQEVAFLDIEELSNPEILNPENFNLLIMPYGQGYPYFASQNLFNFLEKGGNMLISPVLASPFYKNRDGVWCAVEGEIPVTGSNTYFSFTVSRYGYPFHEIKFLQGYSLPGYERDKGNFTFCGIYETLPGDKLIPLAEARDEYGLPAFNFKYGCTYPIPVYLLIHNCEYFKGRQLVVALDGEVNPLSPVNWKYAKDFLLQSVQNIFSPSEGKVVHPLPLPQETGTKWEIEKVGDKNILLINGEPAKGIITSPLGHAAGYRVNWWKRAGINYVQIALNFHQVGMAENEDIEKVYEERISELERTVSFLNRYGIGVIVFCYPGASDVRAWMMHAPGWWTVKYPGEEYAYTSLNFRNEYYRYLRLLAGKLAKYPNVIGYRMGVGPEGTIEFLFPDLRQGMESPVLDLPEKGYGPVKYVPYCETMKEDYRDFLKSKYRNDVMELNKSWNSRFTGFSEIGFPVFQPNGDGFDLRKERQDWVEFRTYYVFSRLKEWGEVISGIDKDALLFIVCDCLGKQPAGTNQWKARYFKYLDGLMPPLMLTDYLPGAAMWNYASYYSIFKNSPHGLSDSEVVLSHDTNSAMWDFHSSAVSPYFAGYQLGSFHHYFGDVGEHPLAMNGMKVGNKKYDEIMLTENQEKRDVGIFFGYKPVHSLRHFGVTGDTSISFVSGSGLSNFLWRYGRLPTMVSDEYPGDVFDFNMVYILYHMQISNVAESMLKDFLAMGGSVVKEGNSGKYDENGVRTDEFLPFPDIRLGAVGTMYAKPLEVVGNHPITDGIRGMTVDDVNPALSGPFPFRAFDCRSGNLLVSLQDGNPAIALGDSSGRTLYSAFPLFPAYERDVTCQTGRFYSADYSYTYSKMIDRVFSNYISWMEKKQKDEVGRKLKDISEKCRIPSAGDEFVLHAVRDYLSKSKDFYEKGLYIRALIHSKCAYNLLQWIKHQEEKVGIEVLALEEITTNSLLAENEMESSRILVENIGEANVPATLRNLLNLTYDLIQKGNTAEDIKTKMKFYSMAYTVARFAREELVKIEYQDWERIHYEEQKNGRAM